MNISSELDLDRFIQTIEEYSVKELLEIQRDYEQCEQDELLNDNYYAADLYGDVARIAALEIRSRAT